MTRFSQGHGVLRSPDGAGGNLRASDEAMFAPLIQSLRGIVWEADGATFQFSFVSRHAEEVLGYPAEEWVRDPDFWRKHTHPDDLARTAALCIDATTQGRDHEFEYRMIAADGNVVWLHDMVTVLRTSDGKTRLRGIMLDITDRQRTESELLASQERLALAQEGGRAGIFDWDIVTDLAWWSPELHALYGLPATDSHKETWFTRVHPDDLIEATDAVQQAMDSGSLDVEYRVLWPDGGVHWLHARGRASPDKDGKPRRMLGVVVDVTDRRQLEEQLRHAQKMEALGQLAGGVAHDFNNLLTVITAYSELVASTFSPDDPVLKDMEEIRRAADRAALLTQQLLTFSRKQVLRPEVLDLSAAVHELSRMLGRLLGADVTLRMDLLPDACTVLVDNGQIHQVVMNLAVNARDAMPYGGTMTIGTRRARFETGEKPGIHAGQYVVLSVADTGVGMSSDVQSRIFEPFYTTKEPGRGTGLGLSTVHGIVQQSRGHVVVASEEGKGTTFEIYFPHVELLGLAARTVKPAPTKVGGTILLVEDDDALRGAAHRMLTKLGYTVFSAPNAADALRIVRETKERIQLLITDVVLPGQSGPELAARLELVHPGTKVLFLSGYPDDAIGHHGVLEEGVSFLAKPFTQDMLAAKAGEILSGS